MAGRAARNEKGRVIFYADKITQSMQRTMDETDRRRAKQISFNTAHQITPKTVHKTVEQIMQQTSVLNIKGAQAATYALNDSEATLAAETYATYSSIKELEKQLTATKKAMEKAAKSLDFIEAARLRDIYLKLEEQKKSRK
jgi:excinuclease ABC subunit B